VIEWPGHVDGRDASGLRPWARPAAELALARDDVHIWRVDVARTSVGRVEGMRRVLSEDEMMRADALCFERDRRRFVVVRGVLRVLLGRYLDLDPGQLRFRYGPHGKPDLAPGGDGGGLRFNVSYTDGLALLAFARGREVGVDVECVRHDLDIEGIAARCFTPREAAALRSLPHPESTRSFFAGWTRKEAYAKATGAGLMLPLNRFRVTLTPGTPAKLLDVSGTPSEANRWELRELDPGLGYAGAVAVEGRDWHLACWQWSQG
jgi:4'-phosphopantetheinyl transferase